MLKEIDTAHQVAGERRRRWFTSTTMDLIVWQDDDGQPVEFQFCFNKGAGEQALTWRAESGLSHAQVDCGENRDSGKPVKYKAAPILTQQRRPDTAHAIALFIQSSAALPAAVRQFVEDKLRLSE